MSLFASQSNPRAQTETKKANSFTYNIKKKKKKKMAQPCTWSFSRDIRLELRGKAKEAVEAIKGHVSHVSDIGWTTNVHGSPVVFFLFRRRETPRQLQDDSTHRRRGAAEPPKFGLAAPSQSLYRSSPQSNLLPLTFLRKKNKNKNWAM